MKKPTQSDVAKLAGVSRATVSYIINGKDSKGVPISEETRKRVLKAVDELGYVVNAGAQALRSGDTKTIGVMLPIYENPFFWDILNGISKEAYESGYKVLLANGALDATQADQNVRELAEQRVDGLIILLDFESLSDSIMEQLRTSTYPVVEISSTPSEFDHVHQDYSEPAHALMSHLLELGHRRIAYLHGVQGEIQGLDRLNAYQNALKQAGIPIDQNLIIRCGQSIEDGYQASYELLQSPDRPTALLVVNDLLAMATIRAATDLGLKVPDDLSVASFDDIPFADYFIPRLTTVGSEPEQNGRDAVRLMLRRLREPDCQREVIDASWKIIIRESTGPVPL